MSGFTGEGFRPLPNFYEDNKRVGEFSEWPTRVLEERVSQYVAFSRGDVLMPRAFLQAQRVMAHLAFELAYRDGMYANTSSSDQEALTA